jgi:hypothetical protein
MSNRSARLEIHECWGREIVLTVRDYCGDYLTNGTDYTPQGKPWSTCKQVSTASYRRFLRIVNSCGPVIETTDGYDVRIVAEWPPESLANVAK